MSAGYIGSKYTVGDVYPIRNKKFLVLVDPQNISQEPSDFNATLSTIAFLVNKSASVVVASSFGGLTGCAMHLSKAQREAAFEAFQREEGRGYSQFFSTLSSREKLKVLRTQPQLVVTNEMRKVDTGKTFMFGRLTNEQKARALSAVFPQKTFDRATTASFVPILQALFPDSTVQFGPDPARAPVRQLAPGEILVVENLQFYRNETAATTDEREAFAEILADGVDVFVNDSFASAHTPHASTVELPRLLLHGAAGFSMDRELSFYSKFLSYPSRPFVVAVGGTNIPQKLNIIRKLVNKVDRFVIGGNVALPFMAAKGLSCGLSYPKEAEGEPLMTVRVDRLRALNSTVAAPGTHNGMDPNASTVSMAHSMNSGTTGPLRNARWEMPQRETITCSQCAAEILELCDQFNVDLVLPIDHVVAASIEDVSPDKAVVVNTGSGIPDGVYAMDCGPSTINLFSRCMRECRTLLWTGVLGWTDRGFRAGTNGFVNVIGMASMVSIVAGHTTVQVMTELGVADKVTHVSSGGLSCLSVMEGNALPGVEALSDVVHKDDQSKSSISVHELLRYLPLFLGCTSHHLRVAAQKFVRCVHSKGDYLVSRHDRHTRLWVVAKGSLVARYSPEFDPLPSRILSQGQTIGMYEFITQSTSLETVRAAQNGTVTYYLSSSALNDLLNAHPDLTAQLLQNISDPLRILVTDEYLTQQSVSKSTTRNGCRIRVPLLSCLSTFSGFWEDVIQDMIGSVVLQKLSMKFTPFVEVTGRRELQRLNTPANYKPGILERVVSRTQQHVGLPFELGVTFVRNAVYHLLVRHTKRPLLSHIVAALVVSPLRVLSYGILYSDMNFKLVLDEALIGAAVAGAPLLAFRLSLLAEKRLSYWRQQRVNKAQQVIIMAIVKLLLGVSVFPIIYQRNFLYTQPSASRFWKDEAFSAYSQKQVASLLLRFTLHTTWKKMRTS